MKKTILILFAFVSIAATAQSDKISYSVKVGLNYSNIIAKGAALSIDLQQLNPAAPEGATAKGTGGFNFDPMTSFYVGASVDYPINKWFHLQGEILFVQNKLKGAMSADIPALGSIFVRPEELTLSYIQVPILAKFYVVKNLPLIVGPYLGYGVSFKGKATEIPNYPNKDISYMYKKIDFGAVFGAAYEFNFGLFVEARYVFGAQKTLANECTLKDIQIAPGKEINIDAYTKDVKGQNNSFQAGIGYRFN